MNACLAALPDSLKSAKSARNFSLHSANSADSARKFFSAISTNKYVDENADSVFSFTTVSEMETCMELLESNEEYMALGTQKRSSFNSPMLKWKLFLEEFEKEKKNLLNSM